VPTLNGITSLSASVYHLFDYIRQNQRLSSVTHDVVTLIEKTDVEMTIRLIHEIIKDHPSINSTACALAVESVEQIMTKIEAELNAIKQKIEYNASVYLFSNLRCFDCAAHRVNLELYIAVLDRRRDNLFKTFELMGQR
jgi:acyl-CoA synthetase (NDP forming)